MRCDTLESRKFEKLEAKRVTKDEAIGRTSRWAPARALAFAATSGVKTQTADRHENVFAGLHVDRDELAGTSFAEVREFLRRQRAAQQASVDQGVGNRTRES